MSESKLGFETLQVHAGYEAFMKKKVLIKNC